MADYVLAVLADQLTDAEAMRIAAEARMRSLVGLWEVDGETYGKGVSATIPEVQALAAFVDSCRVAEHGLLLALKRAIRVHPLGLWIKRTIGVGEKQGARLLAAIGDPAARDRPSQLWAYCGYHVVHPAGHISSESQCARAGGVAPSRTRGQKSNWNPEAKSLAFLVAASCIKQAASPYRPVYERARAKYSEAVHHVECVRCGPSGHPAPVGSPLNPGHQHARALRLVAKALLKDLWVEARRLRTDDDAPA